MSIARRAQSFNREISVVGRQVRLGEVVRVVGGGFDSADRHWGRSSFGRAARRYRC